MIHVSNPRGRGIVPIVAGMVTIYSAHSFQMNFSSILSVQVRKMAVLDLYYPQYFKFIDENAQYVQMSRDLSIITRDLS